MSQSWSEEAPGGATIDKPLGGARSTAISDNVDEVAIDSVSSSSMKCKSFKSWFEQRKEQTNMQKQLQDQLVSAKLKANWVHMKVDVNDELPTLATRHYNELKTTLNESLRFHDVFGHERFGYTSSKYNEEDDTREIKSNDPLITSTMVTYLSTHSNTQILT